MDDAEIGEFANDYVEVRRDFLAWTLPANKSDEKHLGTKTEMHVAAGDRHGQPDIGPHMYSYVQHPNGAANGIREGPPSFNEKPENGNETTSTAVGDHH